MTTLAAIDAGSNAIRMIIGTVDAKGHPKIIESIREPVRLGRDAFSIKSISEETTALAVEAFNRFRRLLNKYGVVTVKAVATSALREATNQKKFIERIFQSSNIALEVISGSEEARLIHLAVTRDIDLENKRAFLIDIGGGSVELTLVADGKILATESFNMGTVRLLQKLQGKKLTLRRFNQLVREYVDGAKQRIRDEIGDKKIALFIGTGGNVEAVGDLRKSFFGKDNKSISSGELETILQRLAALSVEERVHRLGLAADRADVIVPAAIVLQKVMKLAKVNKLLIPRVGLKDGVLEDMIESLGNSKEGERQEQALVSARELGRKYHFDEPHGQASARLALQLFDATEEIHHLHQEARLLLHVAALLHDIGQFVDIVGHHKHSAYLISSSGLIGLTDQEKAIVSNVARYHRKSFPSLEHEGYRALSATDRLLVTKLSAMLRLADAMDTEHAGQVTGVQVRRDNTHFVIKLKGDGDMLLERWALQKRAPFFEEVFGVKIAIED